MPKPSVYLSSSRSRDALDRDYTARRFVTSLDDVVRDWTTRSEAALASHAGRLQTDLAYGPHARERFDLYRAAGDGPKPCLVFIHGGFWHSMSKAVSAFFLDRWTDAGFHVAVMDYALAPEVSLTTIVAQARRGLAWLVREAGALGIDASRIVVSGHSAGAHLAAMSRLPDPAGPPIPVRGLALLSGVFELEPIRLCYVNDSVRMSADEAAALSPSRFSPPAPVPLVVAVGENEPVGFQEQSRHMAWTWREAGCPVVPMLVPDCTHFSIVDAMGDLDSPLGRAVRDLFD